MKPSNNFLKRSENIKFKETEHSDGNVYNVYEAEDKETALEFLRSTDVKKTPLCCS